MENTPTLTTPRLLLRRFTPDDAPAMWELLRDEEVNTFLPWFPLKSLQETERFLQERFLDCYSLPVSNHYAVCLKQEDRPIGYINISDTDSHDLGYCLRGEFWNMGIITEGCRAVLEQARLIGIPYLTATHDINNPRSGAVMKKLGMTYRYSYEELVQPKNQRVTFRMYQINFAKPEKWTYSKYWEQSDTRYVEENVQRARGEVVNRIEKSAGKEEENEQNRHYRRHER